MTLTLDEGDRANFYFYPSTLDEYDVKILYKPCATGDCWRIQRKDGTVVIIQTFIKAVKVSRQ